MAINAVFAAPFANAAETAKVQGDFFETRIRPIFANNCYKCHSHESAKLKGGLSLEFRETILKGGEGQLIAEYYFRDVRLNPEFDKDRFTRKAVENPTKN